MRANVGVMRKNNLRKGKIKYRVIDTRTGKVKGLFLSRKLSLKYADKIEPRGKYVMKIEKL